MTGQQRETTKTDVAELRADVARLRADITGEDRKRSFALRDNALRSIFTLATGTLALSITFRGDLVTAATTQVWKLEFSWIALSCCALFYLLQLACEAVALQTGNGGRSNVVYLVLQIAAVLGTVGGFAAGTVLFLSFAIDNT